MDPLMLLYYVCTLCSSRVISTGTVLRMGIPTIVLVFIIMIETPAAVMMSAELAREVDFFSVGTNDLTQYTLAVDRQGVGLDRFFDAHHPAVLRMLRMAAENAHKAGIWIGICGELGADAELIETFLSMGIDELSVSPSAVLPLRSAIRSIDTTTLAPLEL